jgi:hypothetical protein
MEQKTKEKLSTILYTIIDYGLLITLAILLFELPNKYRFILIFSLVVYFIYRLWFKKTDVMYLARDELETIMFNKPLRNFEKGEKIKINKFVLWRKEK